MIQDSIIVRQRHERFIKKVCDYEIVWGFESDEGFATSSSNEIMDDEGEPIGIICFWSEKALAKSCAKGEWFGYIPTEISLSDFIENWCIGIFNDKLLVGTNFDQNMFGFEADPLDLIVKLAKELENQGKKLRLGKYNKISDLIKDIEKNTGG